MVAVSEVIRLARKHCDDNPENKDSARICLADAVQLYDEGRWEYARQRAMKSLAYSVGIISNVYAKCKP
jgi:hypothetical protein